MYWLRQTSLDVTSLTQPWQRLEIRQLVCLFEIVLSGILHFWWRVSLNELEISEPLIEVVFSHENEENMFTFTPRRRLPVPARRCVSKAPVSKAWIWFPQPTASDPCFIRFLTEPRGSHSVKHSRLYFGLGNFQGRHSPLNG